MLLDTVDDPIAMADGDNREFEVTLAVIDGDEEDEVVVLLLRVEKPDVTLPPPPPPPALAPEPTPEVASE